MVPRTAENRVFALKWGGDAVNMHTLRNQAVDTSRQRMADGVFIGAPGGTHRGQADPAQRQPCVMLRTLMCSSPLSEARNGNPFYNDCMSSPCKTILYSV